jgi:hypothetical protein
MKSLILLVLVIAAGSAISRYSALLADETTSIAKLTDGIEPVTAKSVKDPDLVPGLSSNVVRVAPAPALVYEDPPIDGVLEMLERKIAYFELQQDDCVRCAASLGKVVRLSFSMEPPIEGLEEISVVTTRQAFSIFGQQQSDGGKFAIAAGGDLLLVGPRQNLLKINFDASVQMRRIMDKEKKKEGRSNAKGSTVIGLGQKQELLTVGGSKLMVSAEEVVVEEIRKPK